MRIHRKRWALSQRELGQLLGGSSATSVGRIETGRRAPSLPVMLRYQIIFGVSPARFFPDLYRTLEEDVLRRAADLSRGLEGRDDGHAVLKRRLLSSMTSRTGAERLAV